jgi:phosphohistidine phosphatase SixA
VRARETAEEFCEAAGMDAPVEARWLACGMDPESALGELRGYGEFGRVAIVGHEPDFSRLICHLIGASGGRVRMKKGGVALLRLGETFRSGELRFLLPPKAMR